MEVPVKPQSPSPPPALEKSCLQQPLDCDDIYALGYQTDGVYLIYPSGPSVPVPVFCDMTTEGGKWTVSSGDRGLCGQASLQFVHLNWGNSTHSSELLPMLNSRC